MNELWSLGHFYCIWNHVHAFMETASISPLPGL